ncbi:MAG: hypothetical protein JWO78_1862 [Micavibrio sp.]|nr:hypothetical protein [Micavibrio sp.]
MSNIMTDEPTITDDDILNWLKANPKFLTRNPQAADLLIPPTRVNNDKKVADFQGYMIKRLKDDREDVISNARDIVETSRANMNNQARIHNAVLLLLEATNFQDFIHTMTMDFAALLDVDVVSLVVEIDAGSIPQIDLTGVRVVGPGTVELLTKRQNITLESATHGLDEIYGGASGLVKSQALVTLHIGGDTPPALLAFGSRNPQMFQSGMGTEQIGFLGHVIERCFRAWLN